MYKVLSSHAKSLSFRKKTTENYRHASLIRSSETYNNLFLGILILLSMKITINILLISKLGLSFYRLIEFLPDRIIISTQKITINNSLKWEKNLLYHCS